MAGKFELVAAEQGGVRIRLINGAGNVLAVSGVYRDSAEAASGVTEIREHAATAHIADHSTSPND